MNPLENQPLRGGGQRFINQQLAEARLENYALKHWKSPLGALQPVPRSKVAFILFYGFSRSTKDIAKLLAISQRTAQRDLQWASIIYTRTANYSADVHRIYNYIIYIGN